MRTTIIKYAVFGLSLLFVTETAYTQKLADTVIISATQRFSKDRKAERELIFKKCEELNHLPAKKVKAHPSAAHFPGRVSPEAPRINKTITINHTPIPEEQKPMVNNLYYSGKDAHNLYSTGLYAAPGEVVTITIPEELREKIEVQVGCHSDNLNWWVAGGEDWRRMPSIVRKEQLKKTTTTIASAFGGLIYITCPPNAVSFTGDVVIANAVAAPYFVLGKTTDEEWVKMVNETGAPFGELEGNDVVLTISTASLKKVTGPTEKLKTWDVIVKSCYDLAQIPTPYFRKQRIVSDVHIGGGFMHSGYPIMAHHCPEVNMESESVISDPNKLMLPGEGGANWGFFHEIGHNMQNVEDWVFSGTTEVSVNLFSLYIFDMVLGGRDGAHGGVSMKSTRDMTNKYFADGAQFKDWQASPFLGLVTFRQIQSAFGWEAFKTVFRRFHEENAKGIKPQDKDEEAASQRKIDNFVTYFSDATGRNVMPFFQAWGIPVSEAVTAKVAKYPEWMPYNFLPQVK